MERDIECVLKEISLTNFGMKERNPSFKSSFPHLYLFVFKRTFFNFS
jgi:hypothetical protein